MNQGCVSLLIMVRTGFVSAWFFCMLWTRRAPVLNDVMSARTLHFYPYRQLIYMFILWRSGSNFTSCNVYYTSSLPLHVQPTVVAPSDFLCTHSALCTLHFGLCTLHSALCTLHTLLPVAWVLCWTLCWTDCLWLHRVRSQRHIPYWCAPPSPQSLSELVFITNGWGYWD